MNKVIIYLILTIFTFGHFNASHANFDIKARTAIPRFSFWRNLYEKDADREIFPASMTKIMTSIIAFELLKQNELSLDDEFIISEKAWRLSEAGYSSMFIMVGDQIC